MLLLLTRLARLRLAPDTAQRHRIVGGLAGSPRTVLDVGGVAGQLARFVDGAQITTVNVNDDAEVRFGGETLPFEDRSFDVVTSLDVLEHVPPALRARHVAECLRVARERVVLCCPLGTPEHVAAERATAGWHEQVVGAPHPFLAEHLALGLPTREELDSYTRLPHAAAEMRFHGDFRAADAAFRAGVLARHRPTPRTLVRYARLRLARPRREPLTVTPPPFANRTYLIIERRS